MSRKKKKVELESMDRWNKKMVTSEARYIRQTKLATNCGTSS